MQLVLFERKVKMKQMSFKFSAERYQRTDRRRKNGLRIPKTKSIDRIIL